MIIGFAKRGTGKAKHPVSYLTSPHAKDGTLRRPLPEVLRGQPGEISDIIDSLPFKHKYTSGWLSFAPGEQVTPEMERHMMDTFENTVFAGLEADQRPPVLWVRHQHTDAHRHEMHFLMPRAAFVRDEDGEIEVKSLNIAPPTMEARRLLNTYRDFINATYGLASPTNPARARLVSISDPGHPKAMRPEREIPAGGTVLAAIHQRLAKARDQGETFQGPTQLRADIRLLIAESVRQEFAAGRIRNREDVVLFLNREGLSITRLRRDSLTVEIPGFRDYFPTARKQDGRVRLQGILFCETFDVGNFNRRLSPPPPSSYTERPNPEAAQLLSQELATLKERRASYHQSRYRVSPAASVPHAGESLQGFLDRTLGGQALSPAPQQQALHRRQRLTRKRRRKRRQQALRQAMWHETIWSQEAIEDEVFEDEEKDI